MNDLIRQMIVGVKVTVTNRDPDRISLLTNQLDEEGEKVIFSTEVPQGTGVKWVKEKFGIRLKTIQNLKYLTKYAQA